MNALPMHNRKGVCFVLHSEQFLTDVRQLMHRLKNAKEHYILIDL